MKKLYKKGTVHPTPPLFSDQLLAFLPAAILTLITALSPEDREVLAYLISCSGNFSNHKKNTQKPHQPLFNCYCFKCYMSYWVRWDNSPNRQLIHEIIDAYEDALLSQSKNNRNSSKKERKKQRKFDGSDELKKKTEEITNKSKSVEEISGGEEEEEECSRNGYDEDDYDEDKEEFEKGSVRRFMTLLGEKFWSVWSQ
ncbi:hypothetical protein RJ641_002428 [Dillenia turbinata]|uniref:Uncharacterized protein n=1 Tax=Dillenia turbinata TaxID=194707 RepID=A0AAN8ZAD6_9MAGN